MEPAEKSNIQLGSDRRLAVLLCENHTRQGGQAEIDCYACALYFPEVHQLITAFHCEPYALLRLRVPHLRGDGADFVGAISQCLRSSMRGGPDDVWSRMSLPDAGENRSTE
jgi:hypothetical protein